MKYILLGLAVALQASFAMADTIRPVPRPYIQECPEADNATDQQCLLCNAYHEARDQDHYGMIAVVLVTLNRVESPRYPDTICDVVWQKGWVSSLDRHIPQFSWTLDGRSDLMHEGDSIRDAQRAVSQAQKMHEQGLGDENFAIGSQVLWYHAEHVDPAWKQKMRPVVMVGDHIFYREL